MDLTEGTATFALSAQPKEYRQDYSALFYALDGQGERTEIPASYDGTHITAELTVPLSQSAEIYLTLRAPDGTETSQLVDWFPALYSSTTCPPLSLDSGLIFQDCIAGHALHLAQPGQHHLHRAEPARAGGCDDPGSPCRRRAGGALAGRQKAGGLPAGAGRGGSAPAGGRSDRLQLPAARRSR